MNVLFLHQSKNNHQIKNKDHLFDSLDFLRGQFVLLLKTWYLIFNGCGALTCIQQGAHLYTCMGGGVAPTSIVFQAIFW